MAFWDKEELIATVNKPNGEQIQIRKVSKKGKDSIDIRNYYMGDDDEFHPGKGICIPKECFNLVREELNKIEVKD